jgi:transcriptional regulator with XRE-family HTH domain
VADNVRALRLRRELEQSQLAEWMGDYGHPWVQQTVSEVERGRRNLTVDELLSLSIILEEPMQKLLSPMPIDGSDPPALDVGMPAPMPPKIVRQWAEGNVTVFVRSETGPDGTPRLRFTAVGSLVPEPDAAGSP